MSNALILHGTGDSPEKNWFSWLEQQLEGMGVSTWAPQLPDADAPNIKKYNDFIFASDWEFDEQSIIVGHSSGAVAILGLLQALPSEKIINHAILVAAFKNDLGWESLKGLFEQDFDFEKIRSQVKRITLIHSDDDPYCPLEHAQFLAEKLSANLIVIPGAKHFSISTGGERFKELPILLDLIEKS